MAGGSRRPTEFSNGTFGGVFATASTNSGSDGPQDASVDVTVAVAEPVGRDPSWRPVVAPRASGIEGQSLDASVAASTRCSIRLELA